MVMFWSAALGLVMPVIGSTFLDQHSQLAMFGIWLLLSLAYMMVAVAICFMLLRHATERAPSRALLSAGRSIAISRAMMPMTTSSSTRVNAARWLLLTAG